MKTNFITRPKAYKNHWITKPPAGTQIDWTNSLSRGLVGCWLFNEGSGLRANDLSGNKNHGTLAGFEPFSSTSGWTGGKFGTSLNFDGVDDYVSMGNDASLQFGLSNITISMWIKVNPSSLECVILEKGGDVGRFWIVYTPNTIRVNTYFGPGLDFWMDSVFNVNNSAWHHLVATFEKDGYEKIYIDGLLDTQVNISAASAIAWDSSNLVYLSHGTYHFYNGSIDEVRIWNRALSAQEIQQLYIQPYNMFKY